MTTATPPATVITNARRSAMSSTRRCGGRYDGGKPRTLPMARVPGVRRGGVASRSVASFSWRGWTGDHRQRRPRARTVRGRRCWAVGNRCRQQHEAAEPGRRAAPVQPNRTGWHRLIIAHCSIRLRDTTAANDRVVGDRRNLNHPSTAHASRTILARALSAPGRRRPFRVVGRCLICDTIAGPTDELA